MADLSIPGVASSTANDPGLSMPSQRKISETVRQITTLLGSRVRAYAGNYELTALSLLPCISEKSP